MRHRRPRALAHHGLALARTWVMIVGWAAIFTHVRGCRVAGFADAVSHLPDAVSDHGGMEDYLAVNRATWDERAAVHAASADYGFERFISDPTYLSDVVRFDQPLLGDVSGLRGIHLQCHIGTDTSSLARLGAHMTGLDLSPASLDQARRLATACGTEIDYVEADTYSAPAAIAGRRFDLVYTGIGALCWLPDIDRWAGVIDDLLEPGGRLFVREGHPMLWAFDDMNPDVLTLGYAYFETPEPFDIEEEGTYVETDHQFVNTKQLSWNHGIGETMTALLRRGFEITGFVEHRSVPWEALPGRMVRDAPHDEWRLANHPERMPLTYTLQARKH